MNILYVSVLYSSELIPTPNSCASRITSTCTVTPPDPMLTIWLLGFGWVLILFVPSDINIIISKAFRESVVPHTHNVSRFVYNASSNL